MSTYKLQHPDWMCGFDRWFVDTFIVTPGKCLYMHLHACVLDSAMAASAKQCAVSPELLQNIPKRSKDAHKRFVCGMGDWTASSSSSNEDKEPIKMRS